MIELNKVVNPARTAEDNINAAASSLVLWADQVTADFEEFLSLVLPLAREKFIKNAVLTQRAK